MAPNFARHEQFLRIFALLELLSNGRAPIDDQTLISMLKDRLGLSALSSRTLHRDCEFLVSCGYPIHHLPMPGDRKFGWQLMQDGNAGKRLPSEPLTLLELVAFMLGRDLLRMFEGTVIWTGIESLRQQLERHLPMALVEQLVESKDVFHVEAVDLTRSAQRPRLISTLSNAIVERREIEIVSRGAEGGAGDRTTLQPLRLVVRPPSVRLLGCLPVVDGGSKTPLLVDIDRIDKVTPLDRTFTAEQIDPHEILARLDKQ